MSVSEWGGGRVDEGHGGRCAEPKLGSRGRTGCWIRPSVNNQAARIPRRNERWALPMIVGSSAMRVRRTTAPGGWRYGAWMEIAARRGRSIKRPKS